MTTPSNSQIARDALDDHDVVLAVDRIGTGPHAIDSVEVLAQ